MARDKQRTRKKIKDAAYILFRKRGYARVNMDEISDAAGITKRTLYSHFESKDALLESVLEDQHEMALAAFQTFGQKLVGTPENIVRTLFQELGKWARSPRWSGAGFTRLAMELADLPGHPARRIASQHKRMLEAHLANLLTDAGLENGEACASKIFLISEGAMVMMLIHSDKGYCDKAEQAALEVIRGKTSPVKKAIT